MPQPNTQAPRKWGELLAEVPSTNDRWQWVKIAEVEGELKDGRWLLVYNMLVQPIAWQDIRNPRRLQIRQYPERKAGAP